MTATPVPLTATVLHGDAFPDLDRVEIRWVADKTETPIKLHVQGHDFSIAPNVIYNVPINVLEVLKQSTYEVEFRALIEHDERHEKKQEKANADLAEALAPAGDEGEAAAPADPKPVIPFADGMTSADDAPHIEAPQPGADKPTDETKDAKLGETEATAKPKTKAKRAPVKPKDSGQA